MDKVTEQAIAFLAGWAAVIIVLVLIASVVWEKWRARGQTASGVRSEALPFSPSPALVKGAGAPTPAALDFGDWDDGIPLRQWLDRVNRQPDKTPHLAVTGPSGSGKTTLVQAVLVDRPGALVICTPKAARKDPWGGFPAVRLSASDMSYKPLGIAIAAVYKEMLRRNAQEADTDDDWLTLVMDDYSTVIGELPDLKPMVLRMLTLGRSVRIRLVIIDTETNVKAWGIEGRGEARHNLIYMECQEDTHNAAIFRWKDKDAPAQVQTGQIKALADRADLTGRAWRVQRSEAVAA